MTRLFEQFTHVCMHIVKNKHRVKARWHDIAWHDVKLHDVTLHKQYLSFLMTSHCRKSFRPIAVQQCRDTIHREISESTSVLGDLCVLNNEWPAYVLLSNSNYYSKAFVINSMKRRAYCSGLTVDISAFAPCLTDLAAAAVRFFMP